MLRVQIFGVTATVDIVNGIVSCECSLLGLNQQEIQCNNTVLCVWNLLWLEQTYI